MMYRTVNINEETYQHLQRMATQMDKPKAQIVASLVKKHGEAMEKREKERLNRFNKEMGKKIRTLTFSKKITADTKDIDSHFSALARTKNRP